ncbi:hypothetical protein [Leptospirillum ferriphilum]|uniref:hypothetical protein n=1 Tax=Leptospirillum ferriphilum TaxID=178606 RepID=UPI0006B1D98B|nr:hypothetical protein [Leptospirillum ferriphilum]
MTPAMVNKVLGYQEKLGIARELTSRKRHRVFSYASTIEILSRGTDCQTESLTRRVREEWFLIGF